MSDIEKLPEESFTPRVSAAGTDQIPVEPEDDLLSETDVRNLMVQLSPMHLKDISTIEMGVENFFVFHDSPEALTHPESLHHLSSRDVDWLATRRAVKTFFYITCDGEQKRLTSHKVVFRPATMKGEVLLRIKRACIRTSAYAILRHLRYRESLLSKMESSGDIAVWMRKRLMGDFAGTAMRKLTEAQIRKLPQIFERLSFEHFLDQEIKTDPELKRGIFYLLVRRPDGNGFLEEGVSPPDDVHSYLLQHSHRSILTPLSEDFHIVVPALSTNSQPAKTEIDFTLDLYCEAARAILISVMGEDSQRVEYGEPLELYQMISAHSSFYDDGKWPRGSQFLSELKMLIEAMAVSVKLRREVILGGLAKQLLAQLENRFEPLMLDTHDLFMTLTEDVRELFPDTGAAGGALLAILKSNPELAFFTERRGPGAHDHTFVMFRANLPAAFVRNPDKRSFYNLVAKENGYPRGIYDFLISVKSSDPKKLVDQQLELSRAIQEWEDQTRAPRETPRVGWIERLANWILRILGFGGYDRRKTDRGRSEVETHAARRVHRMAIPARAQKAIDYVDRNNRGLIWVDELMPYLNKNYGSESEVAHLLTSDSQDRYVEADSLRSIRRVFLLRKNLESAEWRQITLDYLENRFSPGPDVRALIDYLKSHRPE